MNEKEEKNMTLNDLEARPKQKAERPDETTRPGAYFQPAVDIFETNDELVLVADMPGVPPDGVKVDLEGDELAIEGLVRSGEYDGLKPLHVEYGVGGYYRRFTLGETIESGEDQGPDEERCARAQATEGRTRPRAPHHGRRSLGSPQSSIRTSVPTGTSRARSSTSAFWSEMQPHVQSMLRALRPGLSVP